MERHEQEPPTDLDIMNDLQRTCDRLKAENEKLKVRLAVLEDDLVLFDVSEKLKKAQERVQELEELIEFATDRNVLRVNREDFPEHLQYLFKDPNYEPPQEEE